MYINKKNFQKILCIVPLQIFLNLGYYIGYDGAGQYDFLESYKMNLFGGALDRTRNDLLVCVDSFIPVILFLFLFGGYLYQDLKIDGIYVFTRNNNRRKWFFQKCMNIAGYTFLYMCFFQIFSIFTAIHISRRLPNKEGIIFGISVTLMFTLYTYFFTLGINLLAVYVGEKTAFVCMVFLQFCFAEFAIEFERIPIINNFPMLLKLNPAANFICSWNVNTAIFSIMYFFIFIVIIEIVGVFIIENTDLGITDKEAF